jgi:hypothetical protein
MLFGFGNPLAHQVTMKNDDDCTGCHNWQMCPLPTMFVIKDIKSAINGCIGNLPYIDFDKARENVTADSGLDGDPRLILFLRRFINVCEIEQEDIIRTIMAQRRN